VNDAIELSYKQNDFSKKVIQKAEKLGDKIRSASNAKLYNSALVKQLTAERKTVYKLNSDFHNEFVEKVKINIENGQYDKACDNYAAIIKKYTALQVPKSNITTTTKNKNTQNPALNNIASNSNNKTITDISNRDDAVASKKYNHLVNVINTFSPKVYSSFKTYARTAGTDKSKRQKEMYTNLAGMKVKLPNTYRVSVYFGGSYETTALNALNESLAINRLVFADKAIKTYLENIEHFSQLFTEASEYYEMKDYIDDNFKKADEMHAPLVKAFKKFVQSDDEIRNIIDKISDAKTQKIIEAYKTSQQMMFYYVENAQHLSKKYLRYARHKHFLKLDEKKTRALHDNLRDHYKAFKAYKKENETIFKDNSNYTNYLGEFRDYVSSSKDFYIRVKTKIAYPNGEGEMLKHVPEQARASIEANIKGSVQSLLKAYNKLVDDYNGLNM